MELFTTEAVERSFLRKYRTLTIVGVIGLAIVQYKFDPLGRFAGFTESQRVRIVTVAYPLEYPWGSHFFQTATCC